MSSRFKRKLFEPNRARIDCRWVTLAPIAMLLVVAISTLQVAPALGQVPDVLRRPAAVPGEDPVWISFDTIAEQPETLGLDAMDTVEAYFAISQASEDCVAAKIESELYPGETSLRESLSQAAARADNVWLGTVEDLKPGLAYGHEIGTLLSVRVGQKFRGKSDRSTVNVFVPATDFVFRGERFCVRNDEVPEVPARGERMILFLSDSVVTSVPGYRFHWAAESFVVLRGDNRRIEMPRWRSPEGGEGFENKREHELLDWLEQQTRGQVR